MLVFNRKGLRRDLSQAGFVLPLALSGALILLLSCLSLQAAVLHGRRLQLAERARLQADDLLASAAHRLAARLQGSHRCLLPLDSSAWQPDGLAAACPAGLDPAPLSTTELDGQQVHLLHWRPAGGGGELSLGLGAYQRRFQLSLAPAQGLRELG